MHKGNVIDTFEEFIDPGHPLSETTINLTGITDEMVRGSKPEKEVMELFEKFCEGAILVAHNATFDIGFINTTYVRHDMPETPNPVPRHSTTLWPRSRAGHSRSKEQYAQAASEGRASK